MEIGQSTQKRRPNLNAGHRGRLRERFIKNGAGSFADHQLLELLLFYSVPRSDTNKQAHRMIQAFGSLQALLAASPSEIAAACNVGLKTARLVSLIRPISARLDAVILEPPVCLPSAIHAGEYAVSLLGMPPKELLCLLCLDASHRLLGIETLTDLAPDAIPIKATEAALRMGSVSAILVRTSADIGGTPEPSGSDYERIVAVRTALHSIHSVLFDFIAIQNFQYFSYADHELMRLAYAE